MWGLFKKRDQRKRESERERDKQESEGKTVTETGRETNGKRLIARDTGTSAQAAQCATLCQSLS